MKVSQCKIGEVVQDRNNDCYGKKRIGHVVRFCLNATGETVPMVLWANEIVPIGIHASNLVLYKD